MINSKLAYPKYVNTHFHDLSEKEIKDELIKYRDYVMLNSQKIMIEIVSTEQISVVIESFGKLPNETLFKQLIMYVDKIIADDPIFRHVAFDNDSFSKAMNSLMNLKSSTAINRIQLSDDIKYILSNYELILSGILNFYPVGLLHNQQKDIPLYLSENNFANSVPPAYKPFFAQKARVSNIKDNIIKQGFDLELGRNIFVDFDGAPFSRGMGFLLMESAFEETDKGKGYFNMSSHLPNELPSQSSFNIWVEQSINKTAGRIFEETLNEILFSKSFNSMYLTQNTFTSELLSIPYLPTNHISSDLANLALSLDLPIIGDIGLDALLKIRTDDGQAFENFRISLQSKLNELRLITNPVELSQKLENLKHELLEVEINSVNKAYRSIRKNLNIDAAILVGSLVSSYFTGGLTLVGAAGALLKGGTDFSKYFSEVKENNGYFLWKVKKALNK